MMAAPKYRQQDRAFAEVAKAILQAAGMHRPRFLTPEQRREAVRRHQAGETQSSIARSFGVRPSAINRIIRPRSTEQKLRARTTAKLWTARYPERKREAMRAERGLVLMGREFLARVTTLDNRPLTMRC